jgi:hypothetical protein
MAFIIIGGVLVIAASKRDRADAHHHNDSEA